MFIKLRIQYPALERSRGKGGGGGVFYISDCIAAAEMNGHKGQILCLAPGGAIMYFNAGPQDKV